GAERLADAVDLLRVRRRRDEFAPELRRDEARRGRLLQQDVEDGVAVEVAGLAEQGLGRGIVQRRPQAERKIVAVDAPAGERARGFADVLLAVAAQPFGRTRRLAEREQLHHLAREVL